MLKDLIEKLNDKLCQKEMNNIISCKIEIENYTDNDWKKNKSFFDDNSLDKKYYKNIIYQNDVFELVLIKWSKDSHTTIHQHPKNGCLLKVLEGNLKEERFYNKEKYQVTNLDKNSVGYMHDVLGKHRISALEESYSLHLYSPPKYYS